MATITVTSLMKPVRAGRRLLLGLCLGAVVLSSTPKTAMAREDENKEHYDARVQQYDPDVELKSGGVGGAWMMLLLCGIVCVSVIFKDAKRSHLD